MPTSLSSTAEFNDAIKSSDLSVVHFAADWAEQCGQVDDFLHAMSKRPEYSNVHFYTCQAENLDAVAAKYTITAVPTVLLFRWNALLDRVNGVDPSKIAETVKKFIPKVPLEERLKALINRSPVMVFMKGDRLAPKCGFSGKLIGYLEGLDATYDTFDILTDDEVRQGLKTYSDWPTYPQLYIKGELIGGVDIVKELMVCGDLADMLKV